MIRFASRCATSAAALILLAGPALAQAPAQPSASHIAIAREAVVNSGMGRSFDIITEPLLAQLQQMNVTRPEIKKDLDQVVEGLKPEMELQKQQMVTAAAKVYAGIMTEAELKELNAFFKSPVGMKYLPTETRHSLISSSRNAVRLPPTSDDVSSNATGTSASVSLRS